MCGQDQQPGMLSGSPAGVRGGSGPGVSGPGVPGSPGEAVQMVLAGLDWLASADVASVPAVVQADCLRSLERAASVHVAARSAVLSAFEARGGHEGDGQGSARAWLRWQTKVSGPAAGAAVKWMRRLSSHQAVRDALAAGAVSGSWAREICDWTDPLPGTAREDADLILLAAAAGGADLADLAALAEQIRRRLCPDEGDGKPPGSADRQVRVQTTLGGAGRLDGDLTPRCAEAVQAVLDTLGKKAGPEDTRTQRQRHHDALEEACRRLIAAGMVPDRAGQPTQIQLHISLDDLTRRMGDASAASGPGTGSSPARPARPDGAAFPDVAAFPGGADWRSRLWPRLTPDGSTAPGPVLPGPAAMPGDECDATIIPTATGHLDHDLLDRLTSLLTRPAVAPGNSERPARAAASGAASRAQVTRHVRDLITANALALLSGPHGLASWLRTGTLAPPAASVSLPLDLGRPTDTIPPHLRRAVITRDRHCAAPGCAQPPAACMVHHIIPKAQGGVTKLTNLLLLCSFHHLILVHTWGWTIKLNPDGTTTMTNPDGTKTYHSHSPPAAVA
ncbi:MAG TPA: DUF222 domain-containing protein [Streptosporangiaceae bacterium]|nr:DUF222 domain-containing protein [Streptosporangiaceae bacterium]